tara:strand:+ start:2020 stop:2370 length:351 start_codon:yes stop_codon:yes gene_type:complete
MSLALLLVLTLRALSSSFEVLTSGSPPKASIELCLLAGSEPPYALGTLSLLFFGVFNWLLLSSSTVLVPYIKLTMLYLLMPLFIWASFGFFLGLPGLAVKLPGNKLLPEAMDLRFC